MKLQRRSSWTESVGLWIERSKAFQENGTLLQLIADLLSWWLLKVLCKLGMKLNGSRTVAVAAVKGLFAECAGLHDVDCKQ